MMTIMLYGYDYRTDPKQSLINGKLVSVTTLFSEEYIENKI